MSLVDTERQERYSGASKNRMPLRVSLKPPMALEAFFITFRAFLLTVDGTVGHRVT